MRRTVTLEDWHKEAVSLFGEDRINWKFVCPSCKTVQSAVDFLEIEGFGGHIEKIGAILGFTCIGRFIDEKGCNLSLGGLFHIHTVEIRLPSGQIRPIFEFYRGKVIL